MTESSGCDPRGAMLARLMVDGGKAVEHTDGTYGISPLEGMMQTVAVEKAQKQYEHDMGFILDDPVLSDEEYERFREAWIKLDPRLKVVITQPMAYIPFRDPGDETDWIDRAEYDRIVTHEQAEELREELERDAIADSEDVEPNYSDDDL